MFSKFTLLSLKIISMLELKGRKTLPNFDSLFTRERNESRVADFEFVDASVWSEYDVPKI